MPEMMPLIVCGRVAAVGRASGAPPVDPSAVRPLVRLETDIADGSCRADRSPTKAPIPCWVPLTRSGPRARVALSGGKNPNGVGTSAGLVDQPKFGLP